ncbi:alanine racemase [Lachnospiraceae bacterium KM106-2]|nr:alanine racemase [Lachnospiraceae bacterium KM106-2]
MNTDTLLKWCELDLSILKSNLEAIRSILHKHTKIMAVLKDDAYSHGDFIIAQELINAGIDWFAVSTIDEAIRLRTHQIDCPILILSYTVPARFHELVQYDLTQTVFSFEYGICLENYLMTVKQTINIHLMIDTGMHREGILYDETEQNLDKIIRLYQSDALHVSGIYTHFSVADSRSIDDIEYTKKQHTLFQTLLKQLKQQGFITGITHAQNTPAVLQYPEFQYDYVRIGTLLFGMPYGEISKLPIAKIISPFYFLKAKVFQVKELPKDKFISYGNHYATTSPSTIALVSLGYGDGYSRMFTEHNPQVIIHDQEAAVIGEICMDQLIVDVSNISNVSAGDIVTLITPDERHPHTTLDYLSSCTNCLKHELLTDIGPRVQHIYLNSTKEKD